MGTNPVTLDAAGNTLSDGPRSFTYDNAGRLKTVSMAGATTSYLYNYLGQRTRKTGALGTTVYHYDVAGNLISETRTDGVPVRDYVWVDSTPIAKIEGENLAFLHTDHLNTPRIATDASQQVVWRWEGSAFGETPPTGSATVNLRFPGQYYDAESGLHYNWHRYYDPKIGRYVTSDPIGIATHVDRGLWMMGTLDHPPVELNPYAYVANSSLRWTDPTGGIVPWRDPYDDSEINEIMNPRGKCRTCSDYPSGMHNDVVLPTINAAMGSAAGAPIVAGALYLSPAAAKAAGAYYSAQSRAITILRICYRLLKPLKPNSALPPPTPPLPPPIIREIPKVDPVPPLPRTPVL